MLPDYGKCAAVSIVTWSVGPGRRVLSAGAVGREVLVGLGLTIDWPEREIAFPEDLPGQPVPLERPQRLRGNSRPAAEFSGQFPFRRQLGPCRVFAVPDPPREHGMDVQERARVLPGIIHDPASVLVLR